MNTTDDFYRTINDTIARTCCSFDYMKANGDKLSTYCAWSYYDIS
jgi:hypothetical protein